MTPADKIAIIGGCYIVVIALIRWADKRLGRHQPRCYKEDR